MGDDIRQVVAERFNASIHNISLTTFPELDLPDLDLFFACFKEGSCGGCLASDKPCVWCETSQSCVPNTQVDYPWQILTPTKWDKVCPLGVQEKWEMRAKPFPCGCSSTTFISVVVAVLATLFGVLFVWLLVKLTRWAWRRYQKRDRQYWAEWRSDIFSNWFRAEESARSGEQRPLLNGSATGVEGGGGGGSS